MRMFKVASALVAMLLLLLFASVAEAGDWGETRMRLLTHISRELPQGLEGEMRLHIIPNSNLNMGSGDEFQPIVFFGINSDIGRKGSWSIEHVLGWNFREGKDAPIVSIRTEYDGVWIYSWTTVEWNHWPRNELYWFSQVELKLSRFLRVGVEGESWGPFSQNERSDGFGPNFLMSWRHVGVDLAVHFRNGPEEDAPHEKASEFFMRVHLKF